VTAIGEEAPLDIVDRLFRQAALYPEHPAVGGGEEALSYARFVARVRAFAAALARFPEPRVAIALPQGADAYAAIFAAALAGGYHVPLNLLSPAQKRRTVLSLVDPDVLIAPTALARELLPHSARTVVVDPAAIAEHGQFHGARARHEIAYILFTSGSTGVPKGVVVPRRALNHYVKWLESFQIGPEDRVSQHPNLAFDLSVVDVFGALCFGAALYPVLETGDRLMPARMIARERITVWNSVPSVIGLMMQAGQVTPANLATVRLFNFCGEPLLPEHLHAIFSARPGVVVQNTYGPTETTVSVTALRLTAADYADACAASAALGDPIEGMAIDLLGGPDPNQGEIVISGPQLAKGYWRDAAKTAASFRAFNRHGQSVIGYFTGDWAERRNGMLFFKERVDFQVKIGGYRVELDEVAAAIRACGWPVVCVFKRNDRIAALVERNLANHFGEAALIGALAQTLEPYKIPELILEIEHMPRNENDKVDRRAAAAWVDAQLSSPSR
jgi:D-alanine--poly(phosphoribitol) ligase subunit 1